MSFQLPELPFEYNALEPYIDTATMTLHHDKHHAGYVSNLNAALEDIPGTASKPIESILGSLEQLPEAVRTKVRNNGGGHYNHSLFWKILAPGGNGGPGKETAALLDRDRARGCRAARKRRARRHRSA